jgi:hypothetical protein
MDADWWAEAPAIVHHCIKMYRNACPTFGPIPTEDDAYEEALSESEVYFDGMFENFFQVDRYDYIKGSVLEAVLSKCRMTYHEKRLFRDYIKKKYGVEKVRVENAMVWKGLRRKSIDEAVMS